MPSTGVIRVSLALTFLAFGALKLVPYKNPITDHFNNDFKRFTRVFPLIHFGVDAPDPEQYMRTFGFVEVLWSCMLCIGTWSMRRKAAILLMILCAVMIYTYVALGDYKMAPFPILGFIGLCVTLQPPSAKAIFRTLLALSFIFAGAIKVVPYDNPATTEMKANFVKWAKVFPLTHFGMKQPDHMAYMNAVGFVELVWGLMLLFGTWAMRRKAALFLSIIMLGAMYTLYATNDFKMIPVPALHFIGLFLTMDSVSQHIGGGEAKKHD